jgi:hypothetical protein
LNEQTTEVTNVQTVPLAIQQLDEAAAKLQQGELVEARKFGIMLLPEPAPQEIREFSRFFEIGKQSGHIHASFNKTGHIDDLTVKMSDGRKLFEHPIQVFKIVTSKNFRYGMPVEEFIGRISHTESDRDVIVFILKWLRYQTDVILLARLQTHKEKMELERQRGMTT